MFRRSSSDFCCSTRRAASAALRWFANEARSDEGDSAGTDDVQRQHRARERDREVCVREEDLARDARGQEDEDEDFEPVDGASHLEEDERSERSKDAPKPDPSGGEEPAREHLSGRGREEDVEKLDQQEEPEVPGPREEHQRADRDGEVEERDVSQRRAEGQVDAAPHDGYGQDQDGEQHEERLGLSELLVVLGIRSQPGEPCHHAVDPTASGSPEGRSAVGVAYRGRPVGR